MKPGIKNREGAACVADLSVGVLRDVVEGHLRQGELPAVDGDFAPVERIVRDASAIQRGDVFWAKDGNPGDRCSSEFAYEALMRGAAGVVANCPVEPWCGRWSLHVADTSHAWSKLAEWNRARFTGRTIGIAGGVGKSTTLRMIEAILKTRLTGTALEIGVGGQGSGVREEVERGLLALEPLDDFALFEIPEDSLAGPSESADAVRSEVAVIPSLAGGQWTALARRSAALDEYRNLLMELPVGGLAVLPGDNAFVRRLASGLASRIVWFGRGGDCDVCATDVECRGDSLRFSIDGVRISLPVWGRQFLDCALAAYAVARYMNFTPREISEALARFEPLPHRCNVLAAATRVSVGRHGDRLAAPATISIAARASTRTVSIIDDSKGHSSEAARAALRLLREFDCPGRRVALLGDVSSRDSAANKRIGEEVVSICGADFLIACGEHSDEMAAAAIAAGMPARMVAAASEPSEAAAIVQRELSAGDVVLVHGRARFSMDQLLEQLGTGAHARAA
jgi:UDP-N-acetylmuramyl pentapeptide synthase